MADDYLALHVNSSNTSDFLNKSGWHGYSEEDLDYIKTMKIIKNISIPILSIIGLFGNTVSLLVFIQRRMRKLPVSVFLIALAVVDNLFLISLVITWIDGEHAAILTAAWSCELVIYISYISACLSAWFIVCFTTERFISICYPLKRHLCCMFKQKMAIFILSIITCVLYSFTFWTVKVYQNNDRATCGYDREHIDFMHKATWADTVVTMLIPFLSISAMNIKVIHSAWRSPASRRDQYATIEKLCKSALGHRGSIRAPRVSNKDKPQLKVTRTLLLVSTTFLVLNLPFHALRLYNFVRAITNDEPRVSIKFAFWQEIAHLLYYLTFSCNFVLYTLFGRAFQQSLKSVLLCKSSREEDRKRFLLQRLDSKRNKQSTRTSSL